MKRLFFAILVCGVCSPAFSQDPELDRLGRELGRLNDNLEYGTSRGVDWSPKPVPDSVLVDGKWYNPLYFTKAAHKERMKKESRVKRAQEKKAKYAARRVR